jgi:hypothetical protein
MSEASPDGMPQRHARVPAVLPSSGCEIVEPQHSRAPQVAPEGAILLWNRCVDGTGRMAGTPNWSRGRLRIAALVLFPRAMRPSQTSFSRWADSDSHAVDYAPRHTLQRHDLSEREAGLVEQPFEFARSTLAASHHGQHLEISLPYEVLESER